MNLLDFFHSKNCQTLNVGALSQPLFGKICVLTKFEELEKDTDVVYLALAGKSLATTLALKWLLNGKECDRVTVMQFQSICFGELSSQNY